jgi:hypothetical protein
MDIPESQQWNGVKLHLDFKNGANNRKMWADLKHLSAAELEAIAAFVSAILNQDDLLGSNKPSFTTAEMKPTHDAARTTYQEGAAWHYHCGLEYSDEGHLTTEWWLPANDHGHKSKAIVHYSKKQTHGQIGLRAITIIAFGRDHMPFPDAEERGHPIGPRLRSVDNSEPY